MKTLEHRTFATAIGIDLGCTASRYVIKSSKSFWFHYKSSSRGVGKDSNVYAVVNTDQHEQALSGAYHNMNSDCSCLFSGTSMILVHSWSAATGFRINSEASIKRHTGHSFVPKSEVSQLHRIKMGASYDNTTTLHKLIRSLLENHAMIQIKTCMNVETEILNTPMPVCIPTHLEFSDKLTKLPSGFNWWDR